MKTGRFILVAGLVVIAMGGRALSAAKPPSEMQLLVTFGNGATDALRSDGLRAPGYTADYANGLENVLAILQTSGNFRFFTQNDTRLAASRGMCFDFGMQPVPFAPAQCVNIGQPMHSYTTGDVAIQFLRYGQSVKKLTRFAWTEGNVTYRLGYGTDMDMDGVQDSPAVTVTCIAPSDTTRPCTKWVLSPQADSPAALFRFELITGKRGVVSEGPAQFIGTYSMPFVQTLTVKP
jgi:hypothetical protein